MKSLKSEKKGRKGSNLMELLSKSFVIIFIIIIIVNDIAVIVGIIIIMM